MNQLWNKFQLLSMTVMLMITSTSLFGQTNLHIIARAFIPKEHSGNPGYVRPITSQPNRFVIPEPQVFPPNCNPTPGGDTCFATDDRLFSEDFSADSRATIEFTLEISGNSAVVKKAGDREILRTGITRKVSCSTGLDLVPPGQASTVGMHFGNPAVADGIAQIVVDLRASNPLFTPSPDLNLSGTFTFNTSTNTLRFQGSAGIFPAFEVYGQLESGPLTRILQSPPGANSTVCSLIEFGSGLQLKNLDTTITLDTEVAGNWQSTDAEKRFSLKITGNSATWTERGTPNATPGATLSRTARINRTTSGYRIDRQNDLDALIFANFQPNSLRSAILAHGPHDSFMTFKRDGSQIVAEFSGLRVTKNADGSLKELIQPGTRPPSSFTFQRIP